MQTKTLGMAHMMRPVLCLNVLWGTMLLSGGLISASVACRALPQIQKAASLTW